MRPGTDSKTRRTGRNLPSPASLIACVLICMTGIGCNAHRNCQTVMMHPSPDVCLSNECSLGVSEFSGIPCESCPTGEIRYEQNQWNGSACSNAACNGSGDSSCQQCNY